MLTIETSESYLKLLSYYYRKLLLNTFNKPIVRKEELLYLHLK
jgi:hypothetical protein